MRSNQPATEEVSAYIAVHGGAGVHGQSIEKDIKRALREACIRALAVSSDEGDSCPALSMVETATTVLEDDPLLNAGYGSNLTLDGTVECDAAIMSGKNHAFGSVGAVFDVKNPIILARAILEYSTQQDKLGRIPPLTLVSQGATSFARRLADAHKSSGSNSGTTRLVPCIAPAGSLLSPIAQAQWKKWKARLEDPDYHVSYNSKPFGSPYSLSTSPHLLSPTPSALPFSSSFPYTVSSPASPAPASPPPDTPQTTPFASARFSLSSPNLLPPPEDPGTTSSTGLRDVQDTVGAVSWHPKGGAAASVSSGGLMLKLSGRVGEAAVYGAGCWAQHQTGLENSTGSESVACSVSGTGEHIVRSSLARLVGERVLQEMSSNKESLDHILESDSNEDDDDEACNDTHQILQTILEKEFWEVFRKEGEANPSAGVLLLTREVNEDGASVRLWCAFTTPTMAIAYASPNHPKPKAVILRHPDVCSSRHMTATPRIFITAIPL